MGAHTFGIRFVTGSGAKTVRRQWGHGMKIRIQDNSIRYRITLAELEALNETGRLESESEIYSTDGKTCEGRFVYGVTAVAEGEPSRCIVAPNSIFLHLDPADLARLNDPSEEGVYLRREAHLPSGELHRLSLIHI